MKFDLSKFKKIQEDEHTAVMQHPHGHHVVIAKHILSPAMHAQLKKLPIHKQGGGEVEDSDDDQGDGGKLDIEAIPETQKPLEIEEIPQEEAPGLQTADQGQPGQSSQAGELGVPGGVSVDWNAPAPQNTKGLENFSLPPAPKGQPPIQVPGQDLSGMQKAMNEVTGGYYGEANARGKLAQSEGQTAAQTATDLQNLQAKYQANYAELNNHIDEVMKDYANGHIQPNHYVESMDTPRKVSTAIGLILGGMGGGLTRQGNPALDFLNKQIDRDIGAQQQELGKKANILTANFHKFGNLRDATEMTRAMLMGINAAKFQAAGAQAQGDIARGIAAQHAGAYKMQMIPQLQGIAWRQTLMNQLKQDVPGGPNNTPDQGARMLGIMRMMDPQRAKEMETRYVPNAGFAQVPVDPKTRAELAARQDLNDQVGKLRAFAKANSGSLDPKTMSYGHALASQVQDAYRRANGQGVFREAEADFVKGIVDQDPTKFFGDFRTDPKYRALEDSNFGTLNNLKKSVGLPVTPRATSISSMRSYGGQG